jgi:hypothetical protein
MRTAVATFALVALVAGCGGDSNSPKSIPGTYTLQTVGGDTPPTVIYTEPNYSISVLDGEVLIRNNGTFRDIYTLQENDAGTISTQTFTCEGTYTRSGNSVTLEENDTSGCGEYGDGTWDGNNTLSIDWSFIPATAVHRR